MNTVIFGSNGYIGSNVAKELEYRGETVIRSDMADSKNQGYFNIDIRDEKAVRELLMAASPDVVLHFAGLSSLDKCEKEKALAYETNVKGTHNIVEAVKRLDTRCKLIFLSSDYVFDGLSGGYSEKSPKNPQTHYGITKSLAEDIIVCLPNSIICRSSNVFGLGGNFYNFLMSRIKLGLKIEAYSDTLYTPTYISYLIDSIIKLATSDFTGILHLAGRDKLSRYDFALALASAYDTRRKSIVQSGISHGSSLIAKDSSLNTSLAKSLGFESPSVHQGVLYSLGILKFPYFTQKDARGKITGISNNTPFSQMNICETSKGSVRGNHQHSIAKEMIHMIRGQVSVTLSQEGLERQFNISAGDTLQIDPLCNHTFHVLEDSCWINALTSDSLTGDISG